jgi:hypothetical protein
MERPTDETLWAQYAAAALASDPRSKVDEATGIADAMLAEHRKRFPSEDSASLVAKFSALADRFEKLSNEHYGRGLYPEAASAESATSDAYDRASREIREILEAS